MKPSTSLPTPESQLSTSFFNTLLEGFSGTVAELLARLNSITSESMRRSVRWPKAPSALGSALRRMATNLRAAGIEIQFSRSDIYGRRAVSLVCASKPREETVSCCQ